MSPSKFGGNYSILFNRVLSREQYPRSQLSSVTGHARYSATRSAQPLSGAKVSITSKPRARGNPEGVHDFELKSSFARLRHSERALIRKPLIRAVLNIGIPLDVVSWWHETISSRGTRWAHFLIRGV